MGVGLLTPVSDRLTGVKGGKPFDVSIYFEDNCKHNNTRYMQDDTHKAVADICMVVDRTLSLCVK